MTVKRSTIYEDIFNVNIERQQRWSVWWKDARCMYIVLYNVILIHIIRVSIHCIRMLSRDTVRRLRKEDTGNQKCHCLNAVSKTLNFFNQLTSFKTFLAIHVLITICPSLS